MAPKICTKVSPEAGYRDALSIQKFNASTEEVVVGDQVEKVDVVDGEVESVVDFMKSNFGISSTGTFVLPE